MTKEMKNQQEEIEVGDELLSWEIWDNPPIERSKRWYIIAATIILLLISYGIYTQNFIFALIVLMSTVVFLVQNMQTSTRIPVIVTGLGIVVGEDFYEFKNIKDFSIIYNPPEVKLLYLDFPSLLRPVFTIDLEDTDPNLLREALLPYVFENLKREEEDLTDTLRRVYKL